MPIYDPRQLEKINNERASKEARRKGMLVAYPEQMSTPLYACPLAIGAAARNLVSWLTPAFLRAAPARQEPVRLYSYAIAIKDNDNLYSVSMVHEASGTEQDQMIKHDDVSSRVTAAQAIKLLQDYETQMIARFMPHAQSDFDDTDYKRSKVFQELLATGRARDPVKEAGPDYMKPTAPIIF